VEYDIFISHASEDKDFVRPFANALKQYGYRLWYDEFVLRVGDSLRERIDYGLANSAVGVFIISPAFITKPWPKRELDGFTARQVAEAARLIPLWHHVDIHGVLRFSPPLANIKALRSEDGMDALIRGLSQVVRPGPRGSRDDTIEHARDMIDNGDYDLAVKTAFVAFDRRAFHLIDRLRERGVLPSNYRIPQHAGAVWEAIDKLKQLGHFRMSPIVDLDFLRSQMEGSVHKWSFAASIPTSEEEAVAVVSQVAAILRENPRP